MTNKKNKKHYQTPIKPICINPWSFRCYMNNRGDDIIDDWKKTLSPKGRANFDSILKILKDQPRESWRRPLACGIGDNIFVIHFKDENGSKYRPTGNFLDIYHSFVITTKATEKDGNYIPSDYAAIASSRKREVDADPTNKSCACFANISVAYVPSINPAGLV